MDLVLDLQDLDQDSLQYHQIFEFVLVGMSMAVLLLPHANPTNQGYYYQYYLQAH